MGSAFLKGGIMDIRRENVAKRKRNRRIIYGVLGVLAIVGVTVGLSKLRPAPPSVERSSAYIDTVKRGPMLRQVHGNGTLTPEEIRWIPTLTDGRVEQILLRPGMDNKVKADTVLVILSNPQIQQEAIDAQLKLKAAQADYNKLEVSLQSDVLNQKATVAKAELDATQAKRQFEIDRDLAKLGTISPQTLETSRGNAEQLAAKAGIERDRLENSMKVKVAQLAAQQAVVDQARELAHLTQTKLESLKVRAGTDGVLQQLSLNVGGTDQPLQVGQQVAAGTTIAKVANPQRLKAELKIPETQAKDVQIGQPAEIDTHNGVITGKVVRIDPSVQNGTRTVDVTLTGALPPGAVPDLSVDGVVNLERIPNALQVGRPAFGQEQSQVSMFRMMPDGKTAERVQVKLGRTSVCCVEIISGLREGDQVVLSDMSRWDQYDRVRLE
jgi:HlyD family secretion protein